jgi:predicted permease
MMRGVFSGLPRGVRRLLRLPLTRERLLRDIDDEVRFHLAMRVDELRARGLSEDDANAEALRRFGDHDEFHDYSGRRAAKLARRAGLRASVSAWWQDVRFADRQFRRAPAFTALAVLMLALGIGANAAIFSVVHRLLIAPLPYPDGNRIVMLAVERGVRVGFPDATTLRLIRARSHSLETLAAVSVRAMAVQDDDGQDTVYAFVTPTYLRMLGIAPALGRTFSAREAHEGARVAMISYARWQREFNGRADAIGSTVEINYDRPEGPERRRYTVVGVTPQLMGLPMSPASFNHNLHEAKPGVWLPIDLDGMSAGAQPNSYARLRRGVSAEQATKEIQNIIDSSPEIGARRPTIRAMRAQDMMDTSETRMIEVLFAAVGVLLLISCANVANLLMSRAWTRRREFAVRAALGAGRARLARQVLTESTLLALAGGLLGIAVAWEMLRIIVALRPSALASLDNVHVEAAVLVWSAAISILTGFLFGTLPALFAGRGSVADVLRNETRAGSGSITTRRIRSALIVLEIAMSIVLLAGAGLLVRTFIAMQHVPLGFEPRGMVSFDVMYNARTPREVRGTFANVIAEQLRAVPGVKDVAIGMIPAAGFGSADALSTDPDATGVERSVPEFSIVFGSPGYFRVAGIRLIAGRYPDSLTAQKLPGPPTGITEIVVNRELANRFWPNGGALGAHLHAQSGPRRQDFVVVGIAGDIHVPGTRELARSAQIYQLPRFFVMSSFIVRTATPAADLVPALRRAITSVDPPPFVQTTTVGETFLRESLAPTRFAMALLVAFAAVALILATVGLYGVISYGVTQRTREIGVRVALGAEPSAVARLVVGNGLRLAVAGVAIGAVAAVGGTRALSGMLYGVSPTDPATFLAITIVVGAVALLASYIPARRALRIDPAEALRVD